MRRHSIPTAEFAAFTDCSAAETYITQLTYPVVVKVRLCSSID
jgi:phosphoribosylamine-glycine ligase